MDTALTVSFVGRGLLSIRAWRGIVNPATYGAISHILALETQSGSIMIITSRENDINVTQSVIRLTRSNGTVRPITATPEESGVSSANFLL
jgi:hypothetical protein